MRYSLLIFLCFLSLLNNSRTKKNKADANGFRRALSCWSSNPSEALAITDSLLRIKQPCDVPDWKIWDLQSKIYLRLRNTAKAIETAQKTDSSYKSHFSKPYSEANRIMAISYKDKGDLPRALAHYQIAADFASDTLSQINIQINMAEVELAAGDTTSAINHVESNIQYVRSLQNLGFKGYFYMQYARFLTYRHSDYQTVISYYIQATQILEENKEYERAGFSGVGVAKAYQKMNRPDSCRWWYNKALQLQTRSGSPLGLADVYVNIADYEFNNKNYKTALDLYKTAWPYAQKANYLPIMESILKQLAVTYEKNGDYQSSVLFLKKHNELKDSVGKQKWLAQLTELQVKYSIKQKDKQLKQLQEKVGFFEKIPWLLLGGVFLVLGGGFIWILLMKKKSEGRLDHEIKLEPERTKTKTLSKDRIELWTELKHILENDKLYRDPNLNLNSLAQLLKTNRSTLSEVINTFGNGSFSNLINNYRVKEACELLCNPSASHLTIEGIGIDAGFKSRSAFYAAFTTEIGETPSAFRKRQQHPSVSQS